MHIAINAQLLSDEESYRGAGVSTYSRNLLEQLGAVQESHENGHDGTVDHLTAFTNSHNFGAPGLTTYQTDPRLRTPTYRIFWEQFVLPKRLKEIEADIIHGLVNVLPLQSKIPGVVTVHDLSFLRLPKSFPAVKRLYLTKLCQASVAHADHVIAVSQQTADDLMHFFGTPARKITVVYNGVDAKFRPVDTNCEGGNGQNSIAEFRQKKELPGRFLFYLGTLEPRKNLLLLVQAFATWKAQAAADEQAIKLILAGGKGWFYEQIFQQVHALGLEKEIFFPGYIPDDELPSWFQAAEGFVYPSLFEGFGLPVLEAMACGTPVLCSQASSLLEVVGDSALTFSTHSEKELVAALALMTSQPALRESLRKRGLTQAKRFSWTQAAQETFALYQSIR